MPIDIAAVKRANPLEPTIERLTGKQPERHKINCPFHEDKTPSLHVYDDGGWHCFSCGRSGDVLDFAGLLHFGLGYNPEDQLPEVVDWLGGLGIQPLTIDQKPLVKKAVSAKTTFSLDDVRDWHMSMPASRRGYWHTRGLEDETIAKFMLGWDGIRYTIPIVYRGVCYAVKRRQSDIDDGLPGKYVMAKGSHVGLFNADILTTPFSRNLPLFIVEGEIEAMLMTQLGLQAVSSTGGAATFREHWSHFLAHVPRIVVMYDNDEPGQTGALKVRTMIRRARIWNWPPEYHDGGEFLPTPNAWDWIMAQVQTRP